MNEPSRDRIMTSRLMLLTEEQEYTRKNDWEVAWVDTRS